MSSLTFKFEEPFFFFTFIIGEVRRQEVKALQVLRCGSRQGHDLANGLVETLIGTVSQEVGQVPISHLVLVVAHLMVDSQKVLHVDLSAHFDPEGGTRYVDDSTCIGE